MPVKTIIGGSSNLIVDASADITAILTCVDSYGRVIPTINVKIVAGLTPATTQSIYLPSITEQLNGRLVTINIDRNDFEGEINLYSEETINGVNGNTIVTPYPSGSIITLQSVGATNWSLPSYQAI